MAKTRLNQTHRSLLKNFARDNIACPAEDKARAKTYAKAAKLVSDTVRKKYPADDMAILTKYEVSQPDSCIRGGAPDGRFLGFEFDAGDVLIPIVPNRYCSTRSMGWSQATADAIDAFEKADEAMKRARAEKVVKYHALIDAARNFEDVVDVWPAANGLRDKIVVASTALVALSDDVAAFIRDDNAGANAFAEAA